MKIIKKIISDNLIVLIPLVIFSFLLFPFLNLPTCYDAGTEYNKSATLHTLGLNGYLHAGSLHPPFKSFIASGFYQILGMNTFSYHIAGLFVGYLGIAGIYFLCKNIFNKKVGIIAATLLSTFPLFLANALDNYTDYFVAVFLILSLYFYSKNKLIFYAIVSSFLVLSKDTGLLLPLSVLLVEAYSAITGKLKIITKIKRLFLSALPLFVYYWWYLYVRANGLSPFSEYIFAQTGEKGAFATILYNILTFNFFHQYAKNHMLQLIYLNFTWIYWLIIIFGFIYAIKKTNTEKQKIASQNLKQKIKTLAVPIILFLTFGVASMLFQIWLTRPGQIADLNFNWIYWFLIIILYVHFIWKNEFKTIFQKIKTNLIRDTDEKTKTIFAMLVFSAIYVLTVVSFQIWDTPRYNLPLVPLIIIAVSAVISRYIRKIPIYILLLISLVNFIGLFFSVDPISSALWGRGTASGQTFYTISKLLQDDGLVYNLQYLMAMKKRAEAFTVNSNNICAINNT